ncbi:MAG: hypothetical protein MUF49_21905 [Oculatellaceae cyanobacterium Prado106]|jgi:hypothetical protein|nr:hypothetical protein [Oculatellaceae cyanobacterium Prado106]
MAVEFPKMLNQKGAIFVFVANKNNLVSAIKKIPVVGRGSETVQQLGFD